MMLNHVAQDAARRATPIINDAIWGMSLREALAASTPASRPRTDPLRDRAGPAVIQAITPGMSEGLRSDAAEALGAASMAATGIDYVELGKTVATQAMYGHVRRHRARGGGDPRPVRRDA